MKNWFDTFFSETWKNIQTDIDFSKYEPFKISSNFHVCEKRYKISGETYRLLYTLDSNVPLIEILEKK